MFFSHWRKLWPPYVWVKTHLLPFLLQHLPDAEMKTNFTEAAAFVSSLKKWEEHTIDRKSESDDYAHFSQN